jgi:hypothetical protein
MAGLIFADKKFSGTLCGFDERKEGFLKNDKPFW